MATPMALDLNGPANALKMSFVNWGKTNAKYTALYKTLTPEVLEVGFTGLEEMRVLRPGGWEIWWADNHNRFVRKKTMKQRELLLLHEIMYQFLCEFARGQLRRGDRVDESSGAEIAGRKTKNKTKA